MANELANCPVCGDELPESLTGKWWLHMALCGIDVGGNGPVKCVCGVVFTSPNGSFKDEGAAFRGHVRDAPHDWKKLAVRNTLESM